MIGDVLATTTPKIRTPIKLYLSEAWKRLNRRLMLGWMSTRRFGGAAPDRLLLAPIDLQTSDIFIASEMIAGRYPLAGEVVDTDGQNPFEMASLTKDFTKELHAFGWLRHLRASDDQQSEELARELVSSWMSHHCRRLKGPAWELDVAAKRLMAWLSHSPVVLANADYAFYKRFMANIALQIRYLRHVTPSSRNPQARLRAWIAIAMASLCLPSTSRMVRSAAIALDVELEKQILSDGGHISRNPQVTLDILADLLPLRQTYINLGSALPLNMLSAIDRMFLALRFFRHSNGEIALFNGASHVSANFLMSILQNDETAAQNPVNLNQSGFTRLEAGKSVLLMDTGIAPTGNLSIDAHAGSLSFEFSSDANRLIINSGAPRYQKERFAEFARLTAAHSALIVEDTSSSRVSTSQYLGPIFIHGPTHINIEDLSDNDHMGVRASHNGYAKPYGIIHQRQLRLDRDGKSLSGLDIIEAAQADKTSNLPQRQIAIRFHIHPSVVLNQLTDGSIVLTTNDGDRWIFNATVKPIIEQDIYFADVLGARRSQQITVLCQTDEQRRIAWILKAVEVA